MSWAQSGSLSDKLKDQRSQLRKIEQEIKQHRAKSSKLKKEETNVMGQLSHLDKEISLSKKYLSSLRERERLLEEQIDSLRVGVVYESGVLDWEKDRLAVRLRQMYKQGPNYEWQFLLGSTDMQEGLRRYKFLRMIAERDAQLIEEVRNRKHGLENEQAELTEVLADIAALKKIKVEEDRKLEQSRKDRVGVLKRIRNEKTKHTQAIAELKRSQERLKDLIDQLEARRLADGGTDIPGGDFAKLKGRLMRPVPGKVIKSFGQDRHPKFGTVTFNNGVDIKAPAGTPIRCVAPGRVEFVDWISGYGNCIIINHGGGYYTLYAHAAEIFVKPGQALSRSDVIAEVGNSGSLNGYECHFEIRKSKQALNPMEWFAK